MDHILSLEMTLTNNIYKSIPIFLEKGSTNKVFFTKGFGLLFETSVFDQSRVRFYLKKSLNKKFFIFSKNK